MLKYIFGKLTEIIAVIKTLPGKLLVSASSKTKNIDNVDPLNLNEIDKSIIFAIAIRIGYRSCTTISSLIRTDISEALGKDIIAFYTSARRHDTDYTPSAIRGLRWVIDNIDYCYYVCADIDRQTAAIMCLFSGRLQYSGKDNVKQLLQGRPCVSQDRLTEYELEVIGLIDASIKRICESPSILTEIGEVKKVAQPHPLLIRYISEGLPFQEMGRELLDSICTTVFMESSSDERDAIISELLRDEIINS